MSKKNITIVIPVYNESENIIRLSEKLKNLQGVDDYLFRVLFVDDGSHDESLANLEKVSQQNENFHYISLSRNFGHQAALTAGLEHCFPDTDAVVMMDGDMEHPPELISEMLENWGSGYDVVIPFEKAIFL